MRFENNVFKILLNPEMVVDGAVIAIVIHW